MLKKLIISRQRVKRVIFFIFHELPINFSQVLSVIRLRPFNSDSEADRSRERYRRIVLGASTSLGARAIGMLISVIQVPLSTGYLGRERYGLWMTVGSMMGFFGFADFGMGNGLVNALSEADGKQNRVLARIYVSNAFFLLLGIGALVIMTFFLLDPFIAWEGIFNVKTASVKNETTAVVFVLIAITAFNFPLGVVQRVRDGYQESYINTFWGIIGAFISLGGLLTAIYLKASLPWLIAAISSGQIIALFFSWIHLFLSRPWLAPSLSAFDWREARKLANIGIIFLMLQIFTIIVNSSDNIIIAQIISVVAVSNFVIAQKMFMMTQVVQAFVQPLWPAFGEAMSRREYDWARRTFNRALGLSVCMAALTSIPLVIFGKRIINVWIGPDFVPSTILLVGFALWTILIAYGGVLSVFLNHGDMLKKQLLFYGMAAISTLLMKICLVKYWDIAGAVWATLICFGVFYVLPGAKLAYSTLDKFSEGKRPSVDSVPGREKNDH
jgi:O-antigen/teichoic acid export membrane protein